MDKSTLSDANKRWEADVFGNIYNELIKKYGCFIPDSRIKEVIKKQIEIIDRSTISPFKDIMKTLKRPCVFSNLISFCKIHLFNYIH